MRALLFLQGLVAAVEPARLRSSRGRARPKSSQFLRVRSIGMHPLPLRLLRSRTQPRRLGNCYMKPTKSPQTISCLRASLLRC